MPSGNFESVFSELSHALLEEKAPGLGTHLVGFQVLDQDEDGDSPSRAAGVFGFKAGKNWLYAPVFFMNGRIKGMDMLWAKNQDIFVPLQDDWVSYLLSRQPSILGEPEELNEGDLHFNAPDFNMAVAGRANKYASAGMVREAGDAATAAAHGGALRQAFGTLPPNVTPAMLKEASQYACDLRLACRAAPALGYALAKAAARCPEIGKAVEHFYGNITNVLPPPDRVAASLQKAAGWRPEAAPKLDPVTLAVAKLAVETPVNGAVVEITGRNLPFYKHALSEAEITRVVRGKPVYRDTRKQASVLIDVVKAGMRKTAEAAYELDNGDHARTCPSINDDYTVIFPGGVKRKCYVAVRLKSPCLRPLSGGIALVVDYENDASKLVAKQDVVVTDDARSARDMSDKPPVLRTVGADEIECGKKYAYIGPDYVTLPFQPVTRDIADGVTTFRCYIGADYSTSSSNYNSVWANTDRRSINYPYIDDIKHIYLLSPGDANERRIVIDGKPYHMPGIGGDAWNIVVRDGQHDMRITSGGTFLPADARFIDCGWPINERENKINCAAQALWDDLFDSETTRKVKIASTSSGYLVTDGDRRHALDKRSAVFNLMNIYGLRENDASSMVAGATAYGRPYWIKAAAGFISNSATAPYPGDIDPQVFSDLLGRAAQVPFEAEAQATGINAGPGNEEAYNIWQDQDAQKAIQAANRGQKDVFDVSILKGLVKTLDVSALIDEYLPDLIRGMDRVGRLLFMFYWHLDSFSERYGRQDVVDLEDSLKNIFKGQGDLILFLRRKTAESQPELRSMDMTLSDVA